MVIDSTHIDQWNRERRLILAELGTLLANNPDGMNNGRISSLQNTLINMRLAENSTQLYQLGNASGNIGELVYNPNTKAVIINYSGTASFVHEVTHVSQFEKGDIGFLSEGGVIANDINDEISAYKAQYNFDSNSVSSLSSTSTLNNINDINSSWVQGLNGGGFYTPGGTANTGVSILNKNSTKIDFVRSLGINGIFRYQELIMGIPIRNYPNAVFKIK